jgi:hypothetical protein
MTTPRANHSATMLGDGRVLIAGGTSLHHAALASAEIFDPKTGKFTATSGLHDARFSHTSTLLTNGKVLIAGGASGVGGNNLLASAEIYDPQAGAFMPTGKLNEARCKLPDATLLLDGRVLIIGGAASAEIYDHRTGLFRTVFGTLDGPRFFLANIQLMDGSTRIFGGSDGKGLSTGKSWIYRP